MDYLKDPNEPITKVKKIRVSVRALILNHNNELGYLYYEGKDLFGIRKHYEAAGGGIALNESHQAALTREIEEETGFLINNSIYLDSIIDEYGKINQVNVHHYYVCTIKGLGNKHLEDYERNLIKGFVFKTVEEWQAEFNLATTGVNTLVHQREKVMLARFICSMNHLI